MEEQQLVRRLQRGSEEAFRLLVERFKDRVYNTCLGFIHNTHDAEDLTQEVFLEIYDSIADFRSDAALGTWIYRIAVNKSLELIRNRKRNKRAPFFQSLSWGGDQDEDIEDKDFFDRPGIDLERKERGTVLMKAIEKLSESQRIAFTLHKVDGLSYKEITGVMEKSLPAVESLIYRARMNLQEELREYYAKEFS